MAPAFAEGFCVAAFTRYASEGWWACLDSNQEPDRYERPALTIELQAPQRRCGAATLYRPRGFPATPHQQLDDRFSQSPAPGLIVASTATIFCWSP